MTKIFCSYCGKQLRIMGEPVLSETEDSYMVDVRHNCLTIPIRGKVCEVCNGKGSVFHTYDTGSTTYTDKVDCPECDGTSRVLGE